MAIKLGNDKPNTLHGGGDVDDIFGFGDADKLFGEGASDFIYGGSGNDELYGSSGGDRLYGGSGVDFLKGSDGGDKGYGGDGNDTINGGNGDNTLQGGSANDSITSGNGKDTLNGDDGNDVLDAGSSGDNLYGDDGNDDLFGGKGEDSAYGGSGRDELFGGSGKDKLSGDGGDNSLDGGSANNRLYGGSGNDTMTANQGSNDQFYGGSGFDTVTYANFTAGVVVNVHTGTGNSGATHTSLDDIEKVIGSNLVDTMTSSKDGTIFGGGSNDTLIAYKGATMRGDEGLDILNGANGYSDVFWLQFNKGADTVNKFVSSEDLLLVNLSDFGTSTFNLVNSPSSNTPTGTDPQFVFQQNTHQLWFDSDGTGGNPSVLVATIAGQASLAISDFDLT